MALSNVFENIEHDIKEKEQFIQSQSERIQSMHDVLNELLQYEEVITKANEIIHGKVLSESQAQNTLHESLDRGSPLQAQIQLEEDHKDMYSDSDDQNIKDGDEAQIRQLLNSSGSIENSFREVSISYIAGTIETIDMMRFKRLLYRATRGKALTYFEDIGVQLMDYSGQNINKVIYVIIFQEGLHFRDRIQKICDSFMGKRYQLPDGGHGDKQAFIRKSQKIEKKIQDILQMMRLTKEQMKKYLLDVNSEDDINFSIFEVFRLYFRKEKSVYQNLNKCSSERNLYHGFMWSHLAKHQIMTEIYKFQQQQSKQQDSSLSLNGQSMIQLEEIPFKMLQPPTFFYVNDFTYPFHEIVNTYGVPSYKEINPTFFTYITFPFLFGIMFGDIGHGSLLLFIASILCLFSSCLNRFKFLQFPLKSRYMLLLMGFFATFSGVVYNDFVSMPLTFGKSCYDIYHKDYIQSSNSTNGNNTESTISGIDQGDCVFPFGVDPAWLMSKYELQFMNSLKMKIAVIIGVIQMALGVCMKACNAIYFRRYNDLLNEFLPQILLLLLLFGYMDVLIIIKWLTNYSGHEHDAPSIITTMINIPLNGGKIDGQPFIGSQKANQAISVFFFAIAIITVPWMLFVKPFIIKRHMKKENRNLKQDHEIEMRDMKRGEDNNHNYNEFVEEQDENQQLEVEDIELQNKNGPVNFEHKNNEDYVLHLLGQKPHDEHSDFTEVFIHQLIETIEFVLGTISNTASYLRLWALSLAHSQLSKVFLTNTVLYALDNNSTFLLIVMYPLWASISLFVLMCMDLLECFLHTLRLHWVEFQNKFYKGQGYKFTPFSFNEVLFNK